MKYLAWAFFWGIVGLGTGLLFAAPILIFALGFIGFMAPMYALVESIFNDISIIKQNLLNNSEESIEPTIDSNSTV
ncbi:MAG: hypothetical protein RR840_02615 [Clostridium sp.]